jgi:hypothetical protein
MTITNDVPEDDCTRTPEQPEDGHRQPMPAATAYPSGPGPKTSGAALGRILTSIIDAAATWPKLQDVSTATDRADRYIRRAIAFANRRPVAARDMVREAVEQLELEQAPLLRSIAWRLHDSQCLLGRTLAGIDGEMAPTMQRFDDGQRRLRAVLEGLV